MPSLYYNKTTKIKITENVLVSKLTLIYFFICYNLRVFYEVT